MTCYVMTFDIEVENFWLLSEGTRGCGWVCGGGGGGGVEQNPVLSNDFNKIHLSVTYVFHWLFTSHAH